MVGRSSALDDDDTDSFLPTANYGKKGTGLRCNDGGRTHKGGGGGVAEVPPAKIRVGIEVCAIWP